MLFRSSAYGTEVPAGTVNRSDLNQSGYIDVLDFSLLASNYGTATSTFVPNIPVTMTVKSPTSNKWFPRLKQAGAFNKWPILRRTIESGAWYGEELLGSARWFDCEISRLVGPCGPLRICATVDF